jgi:hypothetical protein
MFRKILRADLMACALKACVQFGAAFAQMRDRARDRLFTFANIGIDLQLVSEVKRNRPVHLFQSERREVLANGLRRITGFERIDDRVEGDTRAGDLESAVALLDIFAVFHTFPV